MNELDSIRQGDTSVLVTLYKKHKAEFSRWIMKSFSISPEDAEEIFQTSVVTFYENVINNKLEDLKSTVKTYLFAIGKYKAMELSRKSNRLQPLENFQKDDADYNLPFFNDSDNDEEDHETRIEVMGRSMKELGMPCSELIVLFYYQKLSLSVMKERLGYKSEESIKSQKFKCMERLRKIYFQHYRKSI